MEWNEQERGVQWGGASLSGDGEEIREDKGGLVRGQVRDGGGREASQGEDAELTPGQRRNGFPLCFFPTVGGGDSTTCSVSDAL
jgi:hypothetical protein